MATEIIEQKKMKNKRLIIISLAIFVVLIIAGVFYFSREEKDISHLREYYQELSKECEGKYINYDCCITSVESMAENNYELEPQEGCPKGYFKNTLRCPGSFSWCEPERDSEYKTCTQDSECIIVKGDCCGCNGGGTADTINKEFKDLWQTEWEGECLETDCPAVISEHPSCFKEARCVEGRCGLVSEETKVQYKLWLPSTKTNSVPLGQESKEITFSIMATGFSPDKLDLNQVDKEGNIIEFIGHLKDDGKGEDSFAGDHIYTGTFEISFKDQKDINYRVSVEHEGKIYLSQINSIRVTRFPIGTRPSNTDFLIEDPETGSHFLSNELIIRFNEDVSEERIEEIIDYENASVIGTLFILEVSYQIGIKSDGTVENVYNKIESFEKYSEVRSVNPHYYEFNVLD